MYRGLGNKEFSKGIFCLSSQTLLPLPLGLYDICGPQQWLAHSSLLPTENQSKLYQSLLLISKPLHIMPLTVFFLLIVLSSGPNLLIPYPNLLTKANCCFSRERNRTIVENSGMTGCLNLQSSLCPPKKLIFQENPALPAWVENHRITLVNSSCAVHGCMKVFQAKTCASTEQATEAFTEHIWSMTIFKDLLISQIWTGFHNYKKVLCSTQRSHDYHILNYLNWNTRIISILKKMVFPIFSKHEWLTETFRTSFWQKMKWQNLIKMKHNLAKFYLSAPIFSVPKNTDV